MRNPTKLTNKLVVVAHQALGSAAADLLLVAVVADDSALASDARVLSHAVEHELAVLLAAENRWQGADAVSSAAATSIHDVAACHAWSRRPTASSRASANGEAIAPERSRNSPALTRAPSNRLKEPGPPQGELRTWLIFAKALDVPLLDIMQPEWLTDPLPAPRLRRRLPVDAPPDLE